MEETKEELPGVPEVLLKKRKTYRQVKEARAKAFEAAKKVRREKQQKTVFKEPEKFVQEFRRSERDRLRIHRQAKTGKRISVPEEHKLAFVVRIRGIKGIHPDVRKSLQVFRLRRIHDGVLVKLTEATLAKLQQIEPYVTWGYPNLKSVRELVFKRGFVKVDGRRTALTDNMLIEDRLGEHGIVCMEDMVHELFDVGKNFAKVSNFLCPFKLSRPPGYRKKVSGHFTVEGGAGNRKESINDLIQNMN